MDVEERDDGPLGVAEGGQGRLRVDRGIDGVWGIERCVGESVDVGGGDVMGPPDVGVELVVGDAEQPSGER